MTPIAPRKPYLAPRLEFLAAQTTSGKPSVYFYEASAGNYGVS